MRSTVLVSLLASLLVGGTFVPARGQTQPPTEPSDDPRPALGRFFDAIRRADKTAALIFWDNDIEGEDQQRYVSDLVSHRLDEMISDYRFEQALAVKLPDAYDKERQAGNCTPTAADAAAAHFTLFRRLAAVNWGRDEDSRFPMEFDSRPDQRRWKIPMRQWHTTTRSSVGDSMLLTGWGAKAKDITSARIQEPA